MRLMVYYMLSGTKIKPFDFVCFLQGSSRQYGSDCFKKYGV